MGMPFTDLKTQYAALKPDVDAAIQRVLDHGQYIMGPEVAQLEATLAAYAGVGQAITVASGTEALVIALMALDIGPGDEVITTPFTFAATAEAIALVGATPVFVDIEPDTALIDATLVEARITARTRALMPVSLYGQCADMDALNAIAQRHGLAVIEDAAQSWGATFQGRRSTGLSTFGCTSFFPSKPLGCYGDGGALLTNDEALAQAARQVRVHGQSQRYRHDRVGVGGRMDTLQCAVLLAKWPRLDWELRQRRHWGQAYTQAFSTEEWRRLGLHTLTIRPGRESVYGQYTVRLTPPLPRPSLEQHRAWRHQVQAELQARGVPSAVHYPLALHQQKAYAHHCCPECCPHSLAAAASVLSLPLSADLGQAHQAQVIEALHEVLQLAPPA